ncbi:MAG: hypothetical protein LPK14_11625 [Hymenobacteraceae bacterium]|nr:hypothetical protein [Hymenobacteraceae bacterium]
MQKYLLPFCLLLHAACSQDSPSSPPKVDHTSLGTPAPPTMHHDSLHYLSRYVGQRPEAAGLWQTEPLKSRLKELLQDDYPVFMEAMQQAQPLKQERVVYTIGSFPGQGSGDFAFMVVDAGNNKLHVSIVRNKERRQFQSGGGALYLPQEIAQRLPQAP